MSTAFNIASENGKAPERFTPLFNDAFLRIFGSADSAPVTQPLVNSILRAVGLPEMAHIEQITADSSLPGGVECKSPRLDVVIVSDDGRLIDLEAQRYKDNIGSKSMFYSAKLLVENTRKQSRKGYHSMPHVVAIVLLEGSLLFPDRSQFLTIGRMGWRLEGEFVDGPDDITLVIAELDKVGERYNGNDISDVLEDESLAWLYLLARGYRRPEEVEQIMESFPTMEEFATRYGIAIGDPDLKRAYDKYWESEMEYNSRMYTMELEGREQGYREGYDEGTKQGMKEGIKEGRKEGIKEGMEKSLSQSIAKLREAGLDEAADLLEKE